MQNKIENGIAAIIVTYNGDEALIANMQALLNQCEKVIIVDNNSVTDMSAEFEFAENNGIEIIRNPENLGIATALNIGVRYALSLGFKYYMTMDQDSVLYDGCVKEMLDVLLSSKKIGMVFPNVRKVYKRRKRTTSFFAPARCITSGNLIKAEVYEKTGGYEDALFIDGVDHDFNFKTKLAGYKILKVNNAFMKQKFGTLTMGRFGKKLYGTPSLFRCYYLGRNRPYVRKKYFFKFPFTIIFLFAWLSCDDLRFRFFSKNSKAIRKEIKRGKKDYKKLVKEIKERKAREASFKAAEQAD